MRRRNSWHSSFSGSSEGMRGLKTQGRVQLLELGVSPEADSLIFNLRPTRWARDPRAAWLSRKEFRQAISHAVDREVFANTVFLGAAVPINGPVTPGNARWFWPSVPRYEFSKDKALALLSGIGLSNRDQDPWLEDDKGVEARFTLLTFRGNTVLERSAAVVGDALRQVGIAVDIVPLEPNVVRQHVVEGDFENAEAVERNGPSGVVRQSRDEARVDIARRDPEGADVFGNTSP